VTTFEILACLVMVLCCLLLLLVSVVVIAEIHDRRRK
jgi:hypothetical protein